MPELIMDAPPSRWRLAGRGQFGTGESEVRVQNRTGMSGEALVGVVLAPPPGVRAVWLLAVPAPDGTESTAIKSTSPWRHIDDCWPMPDLPVPPRHLLRSGGWVGRSTGENLANMLTAFTVNSIIRNDDQRGDLDDG